MASFYSKFTFEVIKRQTLFSLANITLFSQIIIKLNRSRFNKLADEKQSKIYQKGFNCWTHLIAILFCHFAKNQSAGDINNGLRSAMGNLNRLGILRTPSKFTISYQKKQRHYTP